VVYLPPKLKLQSLDSGKEFGLMKEPLLIYLPCMNWHTSTGSHLIPARRMLLLCLQSFPTKFQKAPNGLYYHIQELDLEMPKRAAFLFMQLFSALLYFTLKISSALFFMASSVSVEI